jgi:hypothetical protein
MRRWTSAALAAGVWGVAGCSTVTPPLLSEPAAHTASPSAEPSPPTGSEAPSFATGDLRTEIEVGSIEASLTHPMLEFVSDGHAVVYSSGRAEDAGRDAAPDLWRITPPQRDPELLWRNPSRDHSIVGVVGDLGAYAFVEMPITNERAWNLWLLPRNASVPILLDSHPGDEAVSSLVPSMAISENTVAWTAFDLGSAGPVSQLLMAEGPDWTPVLLHELPAQEAEVWLPSLRGGSLAYMEVHYNDDRSTDERHVYLITATPGAERQRLDESGLATMPMLVDGAVLWKEADPGFNMFNWGRLFRYDLGTGEVRRLFTRPQQYVNYPSAGSRFVAYWGADSFQFSVYDLLLDEARLIERHSTASQESVVRPHIAWDLLVWLHVDTDEAGGESELRWAFLPPLREP